MTSHPISRILELILIAGVFLYAVKVANAGVVSTVADEQREFDSFILVVVWAPTFCARKTTCCKQNACCRGENNTAIFTLRGLWPDYEDGTWPKCCPGPPFDENEITPYLQRDMEKYWPSLQCEMFTTCYKKGWFYAHEWETHGTCAASVTGDQYNFFLTTLGLYYTFDVTEVLFEAGYVPSNSEKYPTAGISSALENAFHGRPQMTCSKTGALEDVRLCLTKKFKNSEQQGVTNNGIAAAVVDVERGGGSCCAAVMLVIGGAQQQLYSAATAVAVAVRKMVVSGRVDDEGGVGDDGRFEGGGGWLMC